MIAVFYHNFSTGNSLSSDDQQLVQALRQIDYPTILVQKTQKCRTMGIFCKDDYDNFALLLVSAEKLMIKPMQCNGDVRLFISLSSAQQQRSLAASESSRASFLVLP